MFASNGTRVTAGSRFKIYGGFGGFSACKYEFIRWTNVDFPTPAIPMVIIAIGLGLDRPAGPEPEGVDMVKAENAELFRMTHDQTT